MAAAVTEAVAKEKAYLGTEVVPMAAEGVPVARLLERLAGRTVAEARAEVATEVVLLEEEATVETAESEAAGALVAPRPGWQAGRRVVGCSVLAVEATAVEGSAGARTEEEADTGAHPMEPPAGTRAAGLEAEQAEGMAVGRSVETGRSAEAVVPAARPKVEPAEREGVEEGPR